MHSIEILVAMGSLADIKPEGSGNHHNIYYLNLLSSPFIHLPSYTHLGLHNPSIAPRATRRSLDDGNSV